MTNSRLYLACTIVVLLLAGCSSNPESLQTSAPSQSRAEIQQWLEQQQHWQIKGKIGIRQGQEINSATMNWTQSAQLYQIFLSGPLGQGSINIKGSEQEVIMQISGEGIYVASSPEQLIEQHLGWSLPISNLFYWIKGIPAPDSDHEKSLDPHNRIATLEQNNWQIRYHRYHQVDGGELPGKIVLSQGKQLRVTLVIKEWNL